MNMVTSNAKERETLIALVNEIRSLRLYDQDASEALAEFEKLLPDTDIDNLCNSDYPDATVVDICLGWDAAHRNLSSNELLDLVKKILTGPATSEAEDILRIILFNNNCIHYAKSDLLYYPGAYFGGNANPSPEQIVDLALQRVPEGLP